MCGASLVAAAPPVFAFHATGADWSAIDAIVETAIAARVTPGLQLCVRDRENELFSKGYGVANLETGSPVTPDTVFRIGSVTKEFTAALVLRLSERGLLSLNDQVGQHLQVPAEVGVVTLAQLIGHVSGLSNYTSAQSAEEYLVNSRMDRTTAEMVGVVLATQPLFLSKPGSAWAYSNSNYILLGAVVEAVTGKPFAEAVRVELSAPLSLSSLAVDDEDQVVGGRASGYFAKLEATTGFANAPFAAMSYAGASGSIRSTASDLCRWRSALMAGNILASPSMDFMFAPARLSSLENIDRNASPAIDYGAGLYLNPIAGRSALRGGGSIQGFVATSDSLLAEQITWTILLNVDGNGTTGLRELMRDLQAHIRSAVLAS